MLTALERAKRAGATIVAVNPLREAGLLNFRNPQTVRGVVGHGTELADHYLQIRVGGDLALFRAIGALLIEWGAVDKEFVQDHTEGFDEYAGQVLDWPSVLAATGLTRAAIERTARLFADSPATIVCWAMGMTQRRDSVAAIREIVNVQLLRGMLGRPGAGLCPVRGHSNVQGDRTMGIVEHPPKWLPALAGRLSLRRPDRVRVRHRGRDPGHARRPGLGLPRAGRELRRRHPGHRGHRGGPARLPADRAHLDQAEPVARPARRGVADPAVPGPHRARPAGRRRAVRHGGGLDVAGARVARPAGTGLAAPALGGGDRGPARPGPARRLAPVGRVRGVVRDGPRAHRRGGAGLRRLRGPGGGARAGSPCRTRPGTR